MTSPEPSPDSVPATDGTWTGAYPAQPPLAQPTAPVQSAKHTRVSAAWAGLILGGLVLVLLLVFILQNGGASAFHFLGFDFTLPRGVALLLAALAGAAVMALVGTIRIFQLRRAYKKAAS